jgi:hypothetical protein
MKYLLTSIAVLLSLVSVPARGVFRKKQSPPVLNLCELVGKWEKYNRQKVRVSAFYRIRDKGTGLYDPTCKEGEILTDVDFRNHTNGAMKRLDRIVDNGKRAQVILEGIFHGPESFDYVDPKLPATIREAMKKSHKRYGHMDAYDTQIEVFKVIEASEVPSP